MIRKLPSQLQGPAKRFLLTGQYKHYRRDRVGGEAADTMREDIEDSVVSIMAADNTPRDRNPKRGAVDMFDRNLGQVSLEYGRDPHRLNTHQFYLEAPEPGGKFVACGTQKARGLDLVFATTTSNGAVIFDGAIHTDRYDSSRSYISLPHPTA